MAIKIRVQKYKVMKWSLWDIIVEALLYVPVKLGSFYFLFVQSYNMGQI